MTSTVPISGPRRGPDNPRFLDARCEDSLELDSSAAHPVDPAGLGIHQSEPGAGLSWLREEEERTVAASRPTAMVAATARLFKIPLCPHRCVAASVCSEGMGRGASKAKTEIKTRPHAPHADSRLAVRCPGPLPLPRWMAGTLQPPGPPGQALGQALSDAQLRSAAPLLPLSRRLARHRGFESLKTAAVKSSRTRDRFSIRVDEVSVWAKRKT